MYPIASGSHVRQAPSNYGRAPRVIWTNDPKMTQVLTSYYLSHNVAVVERAQLQRLFDEQRIVLKHTSEDFPEVIKVGRLAGAGYIVFGEATVTPPRLTHMSQGYQVSTTVREVSAESSQVMWSGLSTFPEGTSTPDLAVASATHWAIQAAICPVESDSVWVPPPGGCKKKGDRTGAGADSY